MVARRFVGGLCVMLTLCIGNETRAIADTDIVREVTFFLPGVFGWSQQVVYTSSVSGGDDILFDVRNADSVVSTYDGYELRSIYGMTVSVSNEAEIGKLGRYIGHYGSLIYSNATRYFDLMGFNMSWTGYEEVLSRADADETAAAFYQVRSGDDVQVLRIDLRRLDGTEMDWSLYEWAEWDEWPVGRSRYALSVGGLSNLSGWIVVSNRVPDASKVFESWSAARVEVTNDPIWNFVVTNRHPISESVINAGWGLLSDPWQLDEASGYLGEEIVMKVTNKTRLKLVFWPGSYTTNMFAEERTNR